MQVGAQAETKMERKKERKRNTYFEGGQDDLIGLISGHLARSNITDQPPVALSGLKLANDMERSVLTERRGSGLDGSLVAGSLSEQKAEADSLGDTDDGEKAGGG